MSITTALKARREQLDDREAGFTLIELLVVVIIIGILAAIAIPVYIGVQNNAKDASAKSDLTNIKTAEVAYYTQNNAYTPTTSNLTSFGYTASGTGANAPIVTSSPTTTFCASVVSGSGTIFRITDTSSSPAVGAACS
jgi:prepilin-type N-terminal cleavage/methylation domain-containing protein